jgi:hypothetical protein
LDLLGFVRDPFWTILDLLISTVVFSQKHTLGGVAMHQYLFLVAAFGLAAWVAC